MNHFQLASKASKITGLNYQFLIRQSNEYLNNIINQVDEQQDDFNLDLKEDDDDINSDIIKEIIDAIMSVFRNKPNVNILLNITFDYKLNISFTITKENLIELSKIIMNYADGMEITDYSI